MYNVQVQWTMDYFYPNIMPYKGRKIWWRNCILPFFLEKPFFQRGSSLLFPFQNFISKILKEKTAIGQIYK